jgi:hypothetical protein
MQVLWDMKITNFDINKSIEVETKGIKKLFGEIIAKEVKNLGKVMDIQRQEVFRSPNRHY